VIRILVSACLLGDPVRYDGGSRPLRHPQITTWLREGRLLRWCPEVAGGLPVPRPAAEVTDADGAGVFLGRARVVTAEGIDVSAHFVAGAQATLATCRREDIAIAILKENSPSCGSHYGYDGSHHGRLLPGQGVTAAHLRNAGIAVFGEDEVEQAARLLAEREA